MSLIGQSGFAFVVDILDGQPGQLGKSAGNAATHKVDAGSVSLHHCGVAVDVNYQTRQIVAFAVNQAESVVVRPNQI